jgi:hypothetical protein
MTRPDPDEHSRRLAAESLAADDVTGWFERLYAEARDGNAVVPWDRGVPNRLLVEWTHARGVDGAGRRALVIESINVQALPERLHAQAIANIARTVAPGGTLLVVAAVREEGEPVDDPPPWPLTRSEIDAFAAGDLRLVRVEELRNAEFPRVRFWRAEYGRPAAAG